MDFPDAVVTDDSFQPLLVFKSSPMNRQNCLGYLNYNTLYEAFQNGVEKVIVGMP